MGDCNKRDCSGWNEDYEHNCWHMDPSTYGHCFKPLKEKKDSGSKVPCSAGLKGLRSTVATMKIDALIEFLEEKIDKHESGEDELILEAYADNKHDYNLLIKLRAF